MDKTEFSKYIKNCDFKNLFIELGWNNYNNKTPIPIEEEIFEIEGIVEKQDFVIVLCQPALNGEIPLSNIRKKIEHYFSKLHQEHLIIYKNRLNTKQIWQFAIQEIDKPKRVREIPYDIEQDPELLYQRARGLLFTLDEEEKITLIDVKARFDMSFGKNTEKITKKFYTEFKKQHTSFLSFINGIDDDIEDKENKNKQWYASLMLNRLMFCYFIQKKGYLDNNLNYLQDKLNTLKNQDNENKFFSFYRNFLLQLFHQGLGKPEKSRDLSIEIGKIPYLNGGIYDIHELEKQFNSINIKDEAFEKIFNFFDQWNWHLDTNIEATGKDINPDVVGYIFEKYINDRASMGAYYTKEDITDYIGKNTIIPFIFDKVKKSYPEAFKKDNFIWKYLRKSKDKYIYDAVKYGIPENEDVFIDLTDDIKAGFRPDLENKIVDGTGTNLFEIRKVWNKKAPSDIALPTEIYRELIDRRKRYKDIKNKIQNGEITEINDFITYNLNIRQFIQDIIENTDDPDLIRHFYKAVRSITILDPTCGSGAFLFAALNILEPLYEACIERMEQFTSEEPRKYKFFLEVLAEANSVDHPNLQYFIFKSIILNNLYGVDIMHEAVEIAKLRLFLKMIAAVDMDKRKPNFGLEPLPDIDFNIRAGNTLVGFATKNELEDSQKGAFDLYGDSKDIDDEAELVSIAYSRFQDSQLLTDKGEDSHKKAKEELQKRLDTLNDKLNGYLAHTYGIDKEKQKKAYQEWLESHQPFHWFAEFYEIINGNGGFDVIIGNPPYVEYKKNKNEYELQNYVTDKAGNLYAFIVERCTILHNNSSFFGMIIPMSSICTDRAVEIQNIFKSYRTFLSNFSGDRNPAEMFEGVKMRLTIFIACSNNPENVFITKYMKWYTEFRPFLVDSIKYHKSQVSSVNTLPKIDCNLFSSVYSKINVKEKISKELRPFITGTYFHNAPIHWVRAYNFVPYFKSERDGEIISSHYKSISGKNQEFTSVITSILNSSLFYCWFIINSNSRDLSNREINNFHFSFSDNRNVKLLSVLTKNLMIFYKNIAKMITTQYKTSGIVQYEQIDSKKGKSKIYRRRT